MRARSCCRPRARPALQPAAAPKGYLQDKESREDALFRPDEWWDEQRIELMTRTSVMKLDAEARGDALHQGGGPVRDSAARDGRTRRLRVDGCDLDGIHYLRAFGNSEAIKAEAKERRAVLIGGSYIGCEVAASPTRRARRGLHDRDGGRDLRAVLRRAGRAFLPGRTRGARRRCTAGRRSSASRATASVNKVVTKGGLSSTATSSSSGSA